VDYDRCIRRLLLGVTLYIATATAMVGPLAFLGLIIANLSRQFLRTYRHSQLITGSVLFGMAVLIGGQLLVERVFVYYGSGQCVHHRGRRRVFPVSAAHPEKGITPCL